MDLRQLHYFVAIAGKLNFNRAAEELHIAQPALSQQIRHLENELGVILFSRERRQIQLTPAGKALLQDARKLLNGVEMAKRTCQRVARGESGRLVIGFTPAACWLFARLVQGFREKFPDVELVFVELAGFDHIEELYREQIDLAVTLDDNKIDPALERKPIYSVPTLLAVPQSHKLVAVPRPYISWEELAPEWFIMFPRHSFPSLFDALVDRCQLAGFSPKILKEATQLETILNLVAAERGLAFLPSYLTEIVQWKGIIFQKLEETTPNYNFQAIWRKTGRTPTLNNFVQLVFGVEN